MQLEGTYHFEEAGQILVNPIIVDIEVSDRLKTKSATIMIYFEIGEKKVYAHFLEVFTYESTWDDEEVEAWVVTTLENYKID